MEHPEDLQMVSGVRLVSGYVSVTPETLDHLNDLGEVVYDVEADEPSDLVMWWLDEAQDEASQTVSKMEEYGSGDLVALGQTIRRLAGKPPFDDPIDAMEVGCLIYLVGKVERALEAVIEDRPVKDDTLLDISVYAKMVRAARAGAWRIGHV